MMSGNLGGGALGGVGVGDWPYTLGAGLYSGDVAAEAMLNGSFDFNRTPIAPLGTKCLVHEKPAVRGTWAPHVVDGWYVVPARYHYRCYTVYIPSTKGTRHSETVEFFPFHVTMPATS